MSVITDVIRLVGFQKLPNNENIILQEQLLTEITNTIDHCINAIQQGQHTYVQNILCLFIEADGLLKQSISMHLEATAEIQEEDLKQIFELQTSINYGRTKILNEIHVFFTEKYNFCRELGQDNPNQAVNHFKAVKKMNDRYYYVLQKLFHSSQLKNKYIRDACKNSFQIVENLTFNGLNLLRTWLRADITKF